MLTSRENFIKEQLEAVHKALTKQEVPLKPKHARRLIVGTHTEKSAGVFWNAVNRIQLEKNPVLTWKFCHLLHKLIRDGHRRVPEESVRFVSKIQSLGSFWQHLHTSGYGICNTTYCKLIIERLEFHKRNPTFPGNLNINDSQLRTLQSEVNNAYELSIEMLDQMDALLGLQAKGPLETWLKKLYDTMENLRWSSLVPQGQCLLAPLILVVLDTSKFYDYLVKIIFKLHSTLPPDTLQGHRERFNVIFRKTKQFYEYSSNLQYFKYLVSIPTLPASAPNFLQASDLDSYQTPHAYLHDGASESPDDGRSVAEESLVDLASPPTPAPSHTPELPDPRIEQIQMLQRALEDERQAKERLVHEARSRIEQYENRLQQMQSEGDFLRREVEEEKEEKERLKAALAARDSALQGQAVDEQRLNEARKRADTNEERFNKLKGVYENFRQEHLGVLRRQAELQKELETSEQTRMSRDEELTALKRKIEEILREKTAIAEGAAGDAAVADEMRGQLARAQIDIEQLTQQLEQSKEAQATAQRAVRTTEEDTLRAVLAILEHCGEELENASSISYPTHLAQASLLWTEKWLAEFVGVGGASPRPALLFGHALASSLIAAAAAAYTASIQHFDGVFEQCKLVLRHTVTAFTNPPDGLRGVVPKLEASQRELQKLGELLGSLPTSTDVDKDQVGLELEQEMARMDAALREAVAKMEEIQRRARESNSGIKLEVNEKILDCCNALMAAIMVLVQKSRSLQEEIVAAGRGTGSPKEFYKRNHQWTEGLLSAAKAVGVAARVLVSAADGVVTGEGKLEKLIVAAQEISASTAQLFVSSRVKADRDSQRLHELSVASRSVNSATANVVASVKSGQQTLYDQDALDFSHLSLHEAKREEMESQVKTLELESQLTRERARLAELRKQHYHLASLVANNDAAPF